MNALVNKQPFAVPQPLPPRIDAYEINGVYFKAAHFFDTFFVTIFDATAMKEGDETHWGDLSPLDIAIGHISPTQLQYGHGRKYRNYKTWDSYHSQKRKSTVRQWHLPSKVELRFPSTNVHLFGVPSEIALLLKPGTVLELSGHSLKWADAFDGKIVAAVEDDCTRFAHIDKCVKFYVEKIAIHDYSAIENLNLPVLNDASVARLLAAPPSLLLKNKDAARALVVADSNPWGNIRTDFTPTRFKGHGRHLAWILSLILPRAAERFALARMVHRWPNVDVDDSFRRMTIPGKFAISLLCITKSEEEHSKFPRTILVIILGFVFLVVKPISILQKRRQRKTTPVTQGGGSVSPAR